MHLDQVDVVGSGEVETIENDVLVQVDHPHSGLGDVLLQDCFCQTRLHLGFNKIVIFPKILNSAPPPNIADCLADGLWDRAALSCKHLDAASAAPSWPPTATSPTSICNICFSVSLFLYDLCWSYIIKCLKRLLVRFRK